MSESTVETTTSGPSLESILWAAAERWSDDPGLVDRGEFADYIFDAWGGDSPTEAFVARFFEGDPTVARSGDMAEAVSRASRSRMHVYNFDLNRLEYVVIEDAEQVVLVSDQGQFSLPNDDFLMRAIERAIIPGSKDPVATGGQFDRMQDGTPRGYFVRRSGEIVAVDVDQLSKTVQQMQLDLKPVFSPIIEDAEGRLMPFKPTRSAMMPNREVELLRQDERISTWTLPKRNTLVSAVSGNVSASDGLSMMAGSAPGLNAPASAATAVLLLLPDGTLARPVIGSGSRWRDMVSDWTTRAAMISIDSTSAPSAVMDDRRYAVQTDRVVAVFSGVRQTTDSSASIGQVGLTSQTRGEAIAAVRMLDANIRVLGDDDLASAILGGAQFVSGLAAPIMADTRAGTGFWLQPEIIFAPSSDDRAYASREMELRSAGLDNAALETQLASPSQEIVAVQGPTGDPWSNWALQAGDSSGASAALIGRDVDGGTVGNVMDPSAMALFARSNRKIGSTFDGSTSTFASDVRPGMAVRVPSERIVAFRAPDGAIVYQPQANSQVRLASVHRSIGSSDSGSATYSTQRGAPAPKQFSATIGARSGAMPATALAALATALDRTAAASGYKLPRVVSFASADDAGPAGEYFSTTLSQSSPRRSQAMLTETPILAGSVGRMVLSMPFPTSGEVVVGSDLDEALQAWMAAPAVSVGDSTSAMSSSSYYSSAMSGGSASGVMLGSFGGAASGAMAGGLALRGGSGVGGSVAGGSVGGGSSGYGSSSLSNASVVTAGNPVIPSSAFVSGGAGPGVVAVPADFSGGPFVPGSTYAVGGSLPGAVVSSNAGGVTNFGSAGGSGSFASPDVSGDAGSFSSGTAGGGTIVQGPNGVSYVVQSVPGAGSTSGGAVSAPGMGPSFAGVDLGSAHREAIGQATQASFVMQMPAAAQTLSSRASVARLPRLLSQALNSSGQWLPGSGTPLPSAVRDFAMSGPFDWPELAQIGAFPQQQELPSGVSTRVLNPGEEEIQIPMPLWAQMGRGQLSSTEAVMASPRMQPGFAPPLGMYRLVKPPEVDFAGGAPEGTPGVITLQGPTQLGLDRSLNNAVEARKSGTSFVLGRIPVSDGETLVSRRGRIKIGAPLGSSGDGAAAGSALSGDSASTFSGNSPSSFSALSSMGQTGSMGQIGSFATGGSSAGSAIGGSFGSASPDMTSSGSNFAGSSQASGVSSLGGDAPTGTLVTSSAPTTLRVPSFSDAASEAPDLGAASNAPSASGRPFAGALRSALRMSDDVGSRMMPSAASSTSASFSGSGSMIGASGSSSAGWAPSSFGGSNNLVAGQPNFGSGGGIANGVGGSGFGGTSSLVSGAPQGSFVSGGNGGAGTSSSAFAGFSSGSSGASLASGATATSGSNGAGAPGVSGLPMGAWSGANPGNLGYTPWVYGSRFEPSEQSRGGVDINSGSRLGKPSYPSLPGMLRFKYIGAPLWWSSATGNAMSSSGTTDSSGAETGAVARSLSSGLQAANSAASIWRSVFVSPGNQRAGSRGSRSSSDAGSMDSGWDRNADDMSSLSSKMALIAVGMGGGAAVTAGSAASKLTGPETVYVAMDSAGRGGMTSAAQAGSPGELNMKIVAAIPPTPPPLADMAAATSTNNAVRPRHSKAHAGSDEHKDEGGVSRGKIEGSVDAIAQRIYHRIVRRLDSDRERFGG